MGTPYFAATLRRVKTSTKRSRNNEEEEVAVFFYIALWTLALS
jgi:hypothetical protein